MRLSPPFVALSLLLGFPAASPAQAARLTRLAPGQVLAEADLLVNDQDGSIVAGLETSPGAPADALGPRLTIRSHGAVRQVTPELLEITLKGESFYLKMEMDGFIALYSAHAGRPDLMLWRNSFAEGTSEVIGSSLELDAAGTLKIMRPAVSPDGDRCIWRSHYP